MRDLDYEFRESYYSLLAGNILIDSSPIPFVYAQYPIDNPPGNPDNYVLLETIYSTGWRDDTFDYTDTTIQLRVVTKALQNNSGAICDSISNQILCIIIPGPNPEVVQVVSGWVMNSMLVNKIVQAGLNDGQKKIVSKILQIKHKVRHYSCDFNVGNIFYGVQTTGVDPTDFSHSLSQNCELPISVDYGTQDDPMFYWLAVPAGCGLKSDWLDLNDTGNGAKIGQPTDLYEIRSMDIMGDPYTLYITRYVTGWNGFSAQVKYYTL